VAWTLPNGILEAPIPGSRLSPWNYSTPANTGFRSGAFTTAILNNSNAANRNNNVLQVTALPNPSGSYFTLIISGNGSSSISLKITDITGRIVEIRKNLPAASSLQTGNNFSKGIYFAEIVQDNKRQIIKLIKQ
jgi:hypothetical protein